MPSILRILPEAGEEDARLRAELHMELEGLLPSAKSEERTPAFVRSEGLPPLEQPSSSDIRMLAHDLRTPISSAVLSLRIARNERTPADKAILALDLAEKSLEALQRIVDSLVAPSAEMGNAQGLRAYDSVELLIAAMDQVAPLAEEKDQALTVDSASIRQSLFCDGVRIVRVLVNLLANAIRNTPRGGHISLTTRRRHNDGHPVIVFSVCDDGPGVSPDIAQSIFEVGVSVAQEGRASTGLGLAVCREIVEAHQGRIWVELGRAQGAVFSFAIPIREQSCRMDPDRS